jgi:hypothetical protein
MDQLKIRHVIYTEENKPNRQVYGSVTFWYGSGFANLYPD